MPQTARARASTPRKRVSDPGRSTLATDVFEVLRSDILHNRLEPGARLMFRDLRERYRSGLSPLREALMRLAAEGLVVLEDHRGFRVAPVSRDEMIDIARILVELEALAIRMACEQGDDYWEAGIVARFHELSKRDMFGPDGTLDEEWEARNVAFHQSLYEACGSPSLKLVCKVLYERHCRYRRLWSRDDNQTRDVAREHELLMKAALSRNAAAVIALLRDHRSSTLADVVATCPTT